MTKVNAIVSTFADLQILIFTILMQHDKSQLVVQVARSGAQFKAVVPPHGLVPPIRRHAILSTLCSVKFENWDWYKIKLNRVKKNWEKVITETPKLIVNVLVNNFQLSQLGICEMSEPATSSNLAKVMSMYIRVSSFHIYEHAFSIKIWFILSVRRHV